MMKRRQLLNTLAAFGCVLASALIPQAPASAQTKTIRMWTFLSATGTSPREVALAQIIKNYEAANPGTKIVDVYVRYLRGKLGSDVVATVRGMGYRLDG